MTTSAPTTARIRRAERPTSPWQRLEQVAPGHLPGTAPWWQAVQQQGTPLRGHADAAGTELLFLWREIVRAVTVYIDVDGHTPHPTQGPAAMRHLTGTDVWYWQTHLPSDWLGSYAFLPVAAGAPPLPATADARRAWWMALVATASQGDAFSKHPAAADGWGRPRALLKPDSTTQPRPGITGHTTTWIWASARLGRERRVWWHRTPGADSRSPLVLLLDGQAWALHLALFPRLDAAATDAELPPIHVLAIDACDADTRWIELGCHAPFWHAVMEELLPQAGLHAGIDHATCHVVAGQSLGGLSALYAALHWPWHFHSALSQSGSFWWPDPAGGRNHAQLISQASSISGKTKPVRALLQIGQRDLPDMRSLSHDMAAALGSGRATVQEIAGGHDWACWREALIPGLQALLSMTR